MKGWIRKIRYLAPRLALAVFAVCLVLAGTEGILRLVGWRYTPLRVQVMNRFDRRFMHAFTDQNFVYDPDLIWRPRRGESVFNRQGFRGPELTPMKPPGECRVFTIGDSNTLGWAGAGGANWPADLGTVLRDLGLRVTVVNAGVWGYSSYQGLRRLPEVLWYRPDLVLISFGSNDALRVTIPDRDYSQATIRRLRWDRFLTHYRLGELILAVSDRFQHRSERLRPRVSLDEYEVNLREMIRQTRANGAIPVLLTRPFIGYSHSPDWWKVHAPAYNHVVLKVARMEKVPIVDLYTYFKDRKEYFADESHFNAEGHRRAARIVAVHLLPYMDRCRGVRSTS